MKNRLKVIRAEQKLTQQELADKAGISRFALSTIECEKGNPDGETIVKLVKATGVPANKIFDELDVKEAR